MTIRTTFSGNKILPEITKRFQLISLRIFQEGNIKTHKSNPYISSNPQSHFVNSQLVCFLSVGIFNYVTLI